MPDLARWVAVQAFLATDRVATYRLNRWNTAFRFYVAHHVAMIDAPDDASALFNGTEPFYCTMPETAYAEFCGPGCAAADRLRARRDVGDFPAGCYGGAASPLTRFVVVTRSNRQGPSGNK